MIPRWSRHGNLVPPFFWIVFMILVTMALVSITTLLIHADADGWEGDDGGLDHWEVSVGRWAERGEQMQLTTPPPPPPTLPAVPAFSSSSSNGRCVGAIPLLQFYSPGWDANTMARIMYGESRCQPGANNGVCCHGLLQIHQDWFGQLGRNVGPLNIYDPVYNIRAAAYVWRAHGGHNGGYEAWDAY